ncbi:MAG: hypothetical protein JXA93_18595, partial [Anaerolineae bacterium]|nr:hypothetical protein [Anaerolineae bacterium]
MALCVYLFGQPRLVYHAQPVKFIAPPKTLPLLAYLLLYRHQAVERRQVAFVMTGSFSSASVCVASI